MNYRPLGLISALIAAGLFVAACSGSSSPDATGAPSATGEASTGAASTEVPATSTAVDTPTEVPAVELDNDGPVATVNGEEISRDAFELEYQRLEASYQAQGVPFPVGDALLQARQDLVSQLVQEALVLQEADSRGITASDEEIDAQYQEALASFPDEETFQLTLEDQGLTEDDIPVLISKSIRIEKLLTAVIEEANLEAPTEEDLMELYDAVSQQQELPPFEEIREQLEAELVNQQESEVVRAFVQQLESDGDIEILLEA